ncbi:unnamed protein product [Chironomus riparius]|uniref:Arrestin-like N-terminal domain-containing protein n=1 Tax=Chironomus riparius TaxID=315576 RepID=A0A9N9RI28_9DIPT|nr:unnamed protein product [Chironomus riparius]
MTKVNLQFEPGVDGKLIYYSGHLLKGVVELKLDHPKKFRGLHVTIFGSARAHWTKRERKYRRDFGLFGNGYRRTNDYHTVHYEGIEVYVNTRSYLFGKSGGPTFEMAPGTHRYEFNCQLPP